MSNKIKEKIKKILQKLSKNDNFTEEDDIFEKGIIDSLATIKLIYQLEEKFQIKIEQEDIKKDNLKSVNKLKKFIESKINRK